MSRLTRRAWNKLTARGLIAGALMMRTPKTFAETLEHADAARRASKSSESSLYLTSDHKDYVLDSIVLMVRLEDMPQAGGKVRDCDVRTIYTLRAVKDISPDNGVFQEFYGSDIAKVQNWPGTNQEVNFKVRPNEIIYDVLFGGLKAGQTTNFVTGAHLVYNLPLQKERNTLGSKALLAANQDYWSYPNSSDTIGELTMVLESKSLKLSPVGQAAKRFAQQDLKSRGNLKLIAESAITKRSDVASDWSSVSARWKNVSPNETVVLTYSW
jgi:hypothetical protein